MARSNSKNNMFDITKYIPDVTGLEKKKKEEEKQLFETPDYIGDVIDWLKEKGKSLTTTLPIKGLGETPKVSVKPKWEEVTLPEPSKPAGIKWEEVTKGTPKLYLTPTFPTTTPATPSPAPAPSVPAIDKKKLEEIDKQLREAKRKALEIQKKLEEMKKKKTEEKVEETEEKKETPQISTSSMRTTEKEEEEGYNLVKKKLDELEKKYGTENAQAIAQQLIDLHQKELKALKAETETEFERRKQEAEEKLEETLGRIERAYEQLGYKPGFAGSTLEALNRDLAYAQAQFEKVNTLLEKAKREALAKAEATQAEEDWNRYRTLFNTQLDLINQHLKNIQAYNNAKIQLLNQLSLAETREAAAERTRQQTLFDKLDKLTSPFIGKGIDYDSLPEELKTSIEQTAEDAGIPIETIKEAMKSRTIKGTAKIGDTLVFYDENGNIVKSIVGKSETTPTEETMTLLNAYIRGDIEKLPTNKQGIAALNLMESIFDKYPILRLTFDYRTLLANQIESGAILTSPFVVENKLDLGLVKYAVLNDLGVTPDDKIITQIENAFRDLEVSTYLKKIAAKSELAEGKIVPAIVDRPLVEVIEEKKPKEEEETSKSEKGWIQKLLGM